MHGKTLRLPLPNLTRHRISAMPWLRRHRSVYYLILLAGLLAVIFASYRSFNTAELPQKPLSDLLTALDQKQASMARSIVLMPELIEPTSKRASTARSTPRDTRLLSPGNFAIARRRLTPRHLPRPICCSRSWYQT